MRTRTLVLALAALLSAGCSQIAIRSAPAKAPQASTSRLAEHATQIFWQSFVEARYDNIPEAHHLLTAAYLENPNDPRLALLLAHTHLWRIAERARLDSVPPGITDHMILADRYFAEARRLAPDDDRIPGWLGSTRLALGTIHRDERLRREGYFMLKGAAAEYPQFNDFSFAYSLISQAPDSPRFAEGIAALWDNIERCAERRFDRNQPRFEWAALAVLETETGRTRVCWNTRRVPHNVEGFFLHFGDALLKNGQKAAAESAYRFVSQVPQYTTWRYKAALEERLANLDDWMTRLRDADPANDPPYMFRSAIACVGCHAR